MEDLQKILMYKMYNDDLFKKIDHHCDIQNLLTDSGVVIFACSGGSDSVFLAYYLQYRSQLFGFSVVLTYFDHEWRTESKDEIVFCQNLAKKLNFEFCLASATDEMLHVQKKHNGSKEAFARNLRYSFFNRIAQEKQAYAIVLAHHQDDQIETFFIRLIRGASLTGLCAMSAATYILVRPLLHISKAEIVAWLDSNNIQYCIDVSNDDQGFLRNRIRKKLIPVAQEIDNRFKDNVLITIDRLKRAENYIEIQVCKEYERLVSDNALRYQDFLVLHQELQFRILQKWLISNDVQFIPSEALLSEIIRFFCNKTSLFHQVQVSWGIVKKETAKIKNCKYFVICIKS